MGPHDYFFAGVLFFLLGTFVSLAPFPKAKDSAYIFSCIGSLNFAALSLLCISGAPVHVYSAGISSFFAYSFYCDALSGFFALVVSVLVLAVSVYSIGYTRHSAGRAALGLLYNLFILSMYAVLLSGNIVTFLISWETMSVISYFLVTFDRDEKAAKAGLIYAVMTHFGTAFIISAFLMLYHYTGTMTLAGMKSSLSGMPSGIKNAVFIFSVIGFGTKAGIIPLHTWLPKAHPAAPSNISALMSGVMIKTGIYGFIRVSMDLLGQGPEWWGISVIVIGAVSSIAGIMYALMERDMKRLLAYSSVENIGIIMLGLGAAIMFRSGGLNNLAAIAFAASLYHALDHALFKGLLFLGAGSVMHATGTKNMELMGGLIKSMPYTSLFFLAGSVSICAFPPFNGFVSEWLVYQALLLGFQSSSITSKIISPLGGAALALTGALAAACFVKAFGISFLGLPQSENARGAKESPATMTGGMAVLALLCLLCGIFPSIVMRTLSPAVFNYAGAYGVLSEKGFLLINETASSLSPAVILLSMLVMFAATYAFILAAGGKRKIKYGDSWDCGIPALTHRMQYTATAFTKPLRMIFRRIYLPKRDIRVSYAIKPFFVKAISYSSEITPFFERYLYGTASSFIHRTAVTIRLLQSGSLHLYLSYILVTLMALLIFGT